MDLNKAQIIWNVTRDPEVRETPNGSKVANFWIATNRNWKDAQWTPQEQVEFHNIVAWWNIAWIVESYVTKWKKVYIEWRLQTRNWEDQTWSKRYMTEIVVENIILLWGRDWNSDFNNSSVPTEIPTTKKPKDEPKPTTKTTKKPKEEEINIEDVPF